MSSFKINVHTMNNVMDSAEQLETVLQQTADSVYSVKRNLLAQIQQREQIDHRLLSTANQLMAQRQSLGRVINVGRQAARLYQENEERLLQSTENQKSKIDISKINAFFPRRDDWVPIITPPSFEELIRKILYPPTFLTGYVLRYLNDHPSDSLVSGEIGASLGPTIAAKASGDLLGYKLKNSAKAEWNFQKREAGISAKSKLEIYGARGEASLNSGVINNSVQGQLLTGAVTGKVSATLFKDGRLDPSLEAKVSAGGNVVSGKIDQTVGSDDFNYHAGAKGELLTAEAKAGISISKDGVEASAGAEAYVAKGEVSGGFTLFGIRFDASLEGKAGGGGLKAGGSVGKDSVSGELGAGLGFGGGIKIKIDWSNAFWKKWR